MKACRLFNFAYIATKDIETIKSECDQFLPYLSYVQEHAKNDLSKQSSIIESVKSNPQKYKTAATSYKNLYDLYNYDREKINHLEYPSPDVYGAFG